MTPARARQVEWDRLDMNGQPHAYVCPMCATFVPIANDYAGVSYRERHIRWHETPVTTPATDRSTGPSAGSEKE